jgi:hypothetical protein
VAGLGCGKKKNALPNPATSLALHQARPLAEIFGDDTASRKDHKITLYPEPKNLAGRSCVTFSIFLTG